MWGGNAIFSRLSILFFGALTALYPLVVVDTLSRLLGEVLFYTPVVLGIFLLGFALGFRRQKAPKAPGRLAPWELGSAWAMGFVPLLLFGTAALSLRLRTFFLPDLYQLGNATGWEVVSRADGLVLKAFVSSTLPMFFMAFVVTGLAGVARGSQLGPLLRRFEPVSLGQQEGASLVLAGGCLGCAAFGWGNSYGSLFQLGFGAAVVAAMMAVAFSIRGKEGRVWGVLGAVSAFAFALLGICAMRVEAFFDRHFFYEGPDTEVLSRLDTPHQAVALVRVPHKNEISLYLNRQLQFSYAPSAENPFGSDPYHAVLTHTALGLCERPKTVLILGSGAGLVAKEVILHPQVQQVVQVEKDRAWYEFARSSPLLQPVHSGIFDHPKVKGVIEDPFLYVLQSSGERFDVIYKNFPEGVGEALGRSVSLEFLRELKRLLRPNGILALHSDYYGTRSYWTVVRTLKAAGFAYIVTLNDNFLKPDTLEGIVLASQGPFQFSRLAEYAPSQKLIDRRWIPPPEGLAHDAAEDFLNYQMDQHAAQVNSRYFGAYLKALREENGFFLPLEFPIGVY